MFGGQQLAGVAARCQKAAQAARLDLEFEYRPVFLWTVYWKAAVKRRWRLRF